MASSLRRNHFISSACSIIIMLFLFPLWGPGGHLYAQGGVYQDDPAHGRSFNRFRAKVILTPPVFTDSAHLPTLPLYYGSTGKRDSTIGSIAYTRTDDQHWRYTATGWQRMTGSLSIVGGDTTILSQTLDSTGQLQGRALFSGAAFKISSSPYYLFSADLRKLVINSTNISHGGNDKRFVVNGRALINDLYLEGETINTGTPTGSTYAMGWNPTTKQVEKYTEWPGGIAYPLSPGKYLNAYGSFAPLNTDSVPEGSTNLYFTNGRARAAIGLTTTGSSGAATYNSSTGILNIPAYSIGGLGGVPTSRTITINGTTLDLSADRSWTISGGGGTPGGSNTHVQFNNSGTFGGSSNFTWNNSTNTLTVNGVHNAKQIDFTAENGTIGQIRVYTSGTWTSGYGTGWNSTQFFQNFTGGFKWLYGTGVSPGGTVLMTLSNTGELTPAAYGIIKQGNADADKWYLLDGGAGNRVGVGTGWNAMQYFTRGTYIHKFLGGGTMTNNNTNAWALITQSGVVPRIATTTIRNSLTATNGSILMTDNADYSNATIPYFYTGNYWSEIGGNTEIFNVTGTGFIEPNQKTIVVDATAGNITLTLPGMIGADMVGKVYEIYRKDYSANTVTINKSAADGSGAINNGLSSITLSTGKSIKLTCVSTTLWKAVESNEL